MVDLRVATVDSVLERAHTLFGLRHALEIEVSSVSAQDLENHEIASSYGKEHTTESLVVTLFIHVDLLLPLYFQVGLTQQNSLSLFAY